MQPSQAVHGSAGVPLTGQWRTGGASLLLFGGTLFFSALLLFAVQPLFAKMVLPRLGGTPAVWSIAMVFFQAMLLAGYAYAHLLVRFGRGWWGLAVHAAVMASALFWLPLGIAPGFETPPADRLPLWLLGLFTASIGAPFFVVAGTAPLLQAWFSRTGHRHADDPYFLYAASNLGSFAALLSYPLLWEPLLPLAGQAWLWTAGYLGLAVAVLCCGAAASWRGAAPAANLAPQQANAADQGLRSRLAWIGYASVPSALLVAFTAHLSTNIAAVPFLWVVPLGAFLLTFVVAFQRVPLLSVRSVQLAVPFAVVAAILTYGMPTLLGGLPGIAVNLAAFFVIALAWHTTLAARRPAADRLTEFYLCMSAGGVLGGAFTSLAAPVLFDQVTEFPLLLVASLLVVPEARGLLKRRMAVPALLLLAIAAALLQRTTGVEHTDRSFFGVISTRLSKDGAYRILAHGTTVHGVERIADLQAPSGTRPVPLTYYAAGGPLAQGIELEKARRATPLAAGVVGLGAGSLACYAGPGESWRFYEIDPAVIAVATDARRFTFLSACAPDAEIIAGDARLRLAGEAGRLFDVLVIDAFSSDAIPVHLLTREAFRLYADRVRPDGVVLLHISNQFLELGSVVAANAAAEGLSAARRMDATTGSSFEQHILGSDVVVLARNASAIAAYRDAGWSPLLPREGVASWTDDYSNVVGAILRKQGPL